LLDLKDPDPTDVESCESIDRARSTRSPAPGSSAPARACAMGAPVGATDAARVRRAAHGLIAVATSRERGLKGAETVIRQLTLRA
jgi:hypothetical protein